MKGGVLNINKPRGSTSSAIVQEVKRLLSTGKAGHAGTLDPQAEGVLLVLLGDATKISAYLTGLEKEYEATMVLGTTTSTQDGDGKVLRTRESKVALRDLEEVFDKFLGVQEQIPPMVSAKRHSGTRLYELFRQGKIVERAPRKVEIKELELLSYDMPKIKFRTVCSCGTYVRTLCHDMGEALGCGAYMSDLVRVRIGKFKLSDALPWDRKEIFHEKVESISDALSDFPSIVVTDRMGWGIRLGRQIKISEVKSVSLTPSEISDIDKAFKVFDEAGNLIAMAKAEGTSGVREFRLLRVFSQNI